MREPRGYRGTIRYLTVHWPPFAAGYALLVLAAIASGLALAMAQPGLAALGLVVVIVAAYYLATNLWSVHQLFDRGGIRPHLALLRLSQVQPHQQLAMITLGARWQALEVARRLTTGRLVVIDVYNPQLTPNPALARVRRAQPPPKGDPRLAWSEGPITLLPLPDSSVPAVIVSQVLSELGQLGDRRQLLAEVRRILQPEGRLLLAERTRTRPNLLALTWQALRLRPHTYWRDLVEEAGFVIRREETPRGLIYCLRADRPTPTEATQLALELRYE